MFSYLSFSLSLYYIILFHHKLLNHSHVSLCITPSLEGEGEGEGEESDLSVKKSNIQVPSGDRLQFEYLDIREALSIFSMELSRQFDLRILVLSFFLSIAVSTSFPFISDDIFGSDATVTRHLLQTKRPCPINFEFQNYSIVTNDCRGPQYSADACCPAFKNFACPFSEELNDLTNDCASTMFSYINLHGRYPPGLFASECREGKLGLECTNTTSTQAADSSSSNGRLGLTSSSLLSIATAFFVFFVHLF